MSSLKRDREDHQVGRDLKRQHGLPKIGLEWLMAEDPDAVRKTLVKMALKGDGPRAKHPILGPIEWLFEGEGDALQAEVQGASKEDVFPVLARVFGLSLTCIRLARARVTRSASFGAYAMNFLNERVSSFDSVDGETWYVVWGNLVGEEEGKTRVTGVVRGPELLRLVGSVHRRDLGLLTTPRVYRGATVMNVWLENPDHRCHFPGGAKVGGAPPEDDKVLHIPLPTALPEGTYLGGSTPMFVIAPMVPRHLYSSSDLLVLGEEGGPDERTPHLGA